MSDKNCCAGCYKRNGCTGAGWYCDMCKKDRQTCECYKYNRGEPIIFKKDIEVTCSCKSC